MKIAILGYGVVGSGVDEILSNSEHNLDITCKYILEREHKLHLDMRMVSDFDIILHDAEIDVIVETMGGLIKPYEYIKASLEHKKSVVSANKGVVAKYFLEFSHLALQNKVFFHYEAAVGGVMPIIKLLHDTARIDYITRFEGIINGTTNFILDKMNDNALPFELVLKEAQHLGYAESDPSSDIEGYDVRNKMMIATSIAFDCICDMDKIVTYGISNISTKDMLYFKKKGWVCKLFGCAKKRDASYSITIMPTLFLSEEMEAVIKSNFNIASFYTNSSGKVSVSGQGAGHFPTAHSIIGDLLDIKEGRKVYKKTFKEEAVFKLSQDKGCYLLRCDIEIEGIFKDEDFYYFKDCELKEILSIYENIRFKDQKAVLYACSDLLTGRGII